MKKVNVMATGILMFLSVGMFAQNGTDQLPATAQNFISQHFSSISIAEVKENSSREIWENEKYDVKLANGVELDFDKNGNILEIDAHNNEFIPHAALPSEVVSYLKSNYPDAKVVSWDNQDNGQELELKDGTELEFDKNGKFLKID